MKRPKKNARLQNRKSGAVVAVDGFVVKDGTTRIKLRNESTGRKSEPRLANVKKQYFEVGEPEIAAELPPAAEVEPAIAIIAEEPIDEEEVDDTSPVASPELFDDKSEDPDFSNPIESDDSSPYVVSGLAIAAGFLAGIPVGVLVDYLVR